MKLFTQKRSARRGHFSVLVARIFMGFTFAALAISSFAPLAYAADGGDPGLVGAILGLPGMLFTGIAFLFLMLAGGILFLAGTVFNWVVIRTVFQFGTYFGTNEGMLVAWGVMRDIANIGLLFGFIFMGVLLILNVDGGGHGHGGGISAKKAIPRLIIFAVLLNFSLFASQAVIDVSNAFSASFATLAGESCADDTKNEDCSNVGISGRILQVAGLSSIWNGGSEGMDEAAKNLFGKPYSYAVSLMMLSVFVLVTAVVLLAGAIMLVIRVVILSLLMVTSPIGFAGMVIPKLEKVAGMWWSKLMSQSFFAPIYLLLIFISIKLSEGLMQGDATLANALIAGTGTGVAGNMQVVVVFLVVIGFMIGSLLVASKIGAMGAGFAANSASALVFGATARGANFVGGGSASYVRKRIERSSLGGTKVGRVLVNRALRPIENANLDVRRMGAGALLGAAGISAGAKPAEHATYGDIRHQFADIKARKGSQKLTEQYEQERMKDSIDRSHGNLSPEQVAAIKKFDPKTLAALHTVQEGDVSTVGALEGAQFDKLMKEKDLLTEEQKSKVKDARVKSLTAKAATMTADQFETATKNDAFNGTEKEQMKAARFMGLADALAANDATAIEGLVKNLSKKDLEQVPTASVLTEAFRDALSDKQREELIAGSNRSAAEKDAVRGSFMFAKINNEFIQSGAGDPAAVQAASKISSMLPTQAAKLDARILTHPEASGALSPAILAKILDENKLTAAQMRQVGTNIRNDSAAMSNPQVAAYMEGPAGAMW